MASDMLSTEFSHNIKRDSIDDTIVKVADSDYGSDFDSEGDEEITRILSELGGAQVVTESLIYEDYEGGRKGLAHVPLVSSQHDSSKTSASSFHTAKESIGAHDSLHELVDFDIPESPTLPRALEEEQNECERLKLLDSPRETNVEVQHAEEVSEAPDHWVSKTPGEDQQSPIQRFRTSPNKPLSVTDIVSPAWCELQYWFSLTKFGKIKRTPAMKQGTKVHKELENQVHTYVEIDVETKEDRYGLRIWNTIQGLRTLRATGLTRELEIWGIVEGEVVNGVIDELSYDCPDPELEASLELSHQSSARVPNERKAQGPFRTSHQEHFDIWLDGPRPLHKIYVTDIKTRSSKYIPKGTALRGVQMQLMLYHRLLTDLASNLVPADTVFARYGLDPRKSFTKSFINNIAELEHDMISVCNTGNHDPLSSTTKQRFFELAQYDSLTSLWSLMITEMQLTIPNPETISCVLQAEFRQVNNGKVMGSHCFVFDSLVLDRYISKTLDWWKGRRNARGVDIEEAYKCQVCEFAEVCYWRKEKVEEGIKRHRKNRRVAEKKWKV
ncbi:uncharacterized protein PV09_03412 [Verruconis gallopava]|uniref:Exonuclease V, mitochondrial n=1 Tax=Verruconis gallopava TaxID=253628 RepID=A0A0D1YXZ3_9PEZI|nr:uncharacterized protein PV09_03412 [Verruconis gallopava]KIW05532.1 hypothetical protein PV09_03412 [Verruconis gallopava]